MSFDCDTALCWTGERIKVREFGTGMVIELAPAQLYRVRRYVEKINESRRRDTV